MKDNPFGRQEVRGIMLPNPNYYYCSKCGADHRTGSPCPQVGAPKEDVEIMNDLPPLEDRKSVV